MITNPPKQSSLVTCLIQRRIKQPQKKGKKFIYLHIFMGEPIKFNTQPKDLLFDIFSRLPLKTLYQLPLVCKKWLFYLQLDPEFTAFYHQKHRLNPLLVFTQNSIDPNSENPTTQLKSYHIDGTQIDQFSANFGQSSISSILTCNGILCLVSNSKVLLYDPVTKRVSKIPKSDQSGSTFSWGLGQIGNVFKLLHFYTIEKSDNYHYCQFKEVMCEILTIPGSEIGSDLREDWRFLGKCPFDFLGRKDYTFVDDKLYWLEKNSTSIMSFDLGKEIFGSICFPTNRSVECLDLVKIDEKLCVTDRLPWESTMDVWMMMKIKQEDFTDNFIWVKKFRIDLHGIDHHDVRILGNFEGEKEILIKFGAQSFGFYDVESGRFRDLAGKIRVQDDNFDLKLFVNRKNML